MITPDAYAEFIDDLNVRTRRTVELLKDKDISLTAEAHELLDSYDDTETIFLDSELIRTCKG